MSSNLLDQPLPPQQQPARRPWRASRRTQSVQVPRPTLPPNPRSEPLRKRLASGHCHVSHPLQGRPPLCQGTGMSTWLAGAGGPPPAAAGELLEGPLRVISSATCAPARTDSPGLLFLRPSCASQTPPPLSLPTRHPEPPGTPCTSRCYPPGLFNLSCCVTPGVVGS